MSDSAPSTIGSYRIVEDLGAAPEGRAYRAIDSRSGDSVLVKVLDQPKDPADTAWKDSLARTRRLGRVSHRSLPILYEVGMSEEGPFVAFSPPAGLALRQFVSQGGRVDRERLVDWSGQLLGLLAEVHAEGLLHGHLGVDSIFVGEEGSLSLSGFGLTRLLPDTPEVQPPEQRRGEKLLPSSDLFSLAALMKRLGASFEMGGASTQALASDDPVLQVFQRATAENPEDRFSDAVDMDIALRAAATETGPDSAEESVLSAQDPALRTVMIAPDVLAEVIGKKAPPPAAEKTPTPEGTAPRATTQEAPTPEATALEATAPEAASPSAPSESVPASPPSAPGETPTSPPSRWGCWLAVLLLLAAAAAAFFYGPRFVAGAAVSPGATEPSAQMDILKDRNADKVPKGSPGSADTPRAP